MPGFPVIGPLMAKIFGTRNERFVKRYLAKVEEINSFETSVRALTDDQLRAKTTEFRQRFSSGQPEHTMLAEVFAVAREVMDRNVGIRNIFDPSGSFEPSKLPDAARRLYAETVERMKSTPPSAPMGDLKGGTEPVPAWKTMPIPNEIYEAVRAAYPESRPPYRARPFDVQLVGGMVLADHKFDRIRSAAVGHPIYFGAIAEMKTGEGKTIVGPLACYLHAVCNRQIHVVTVNTYLVRRDRDWTFPFFYHLGLTVGWIAPYHELPEQFKKAAYECDVVYGTTSEFGFDYLRDNMKLRLEDQVQKKRVFAIVDEVDSILIDEARTPLIISGPAHEESPRYLLADRLASHLVEQQKPWAEADKRVEHCKQRIKGLEGDIRNAREKSAIPAIKAELEKTKADLPRLEDERNRHTKYYTVEPDKKQVHLDHEGVAEAQRVADIGSFYVGENLDVPHLLEQALRARTVYERDRDYVVKDGQVVIVDQFTGRLMVGRQWSDGLHQAVEAKEGVEIKPETQTMATITIQNYFKLYERLSGMTGTADTEAQEFHDIYHMDVVVIPTNLPVVRNDFNDRVYLTGKDKWESIVEEIKAFHDVGRPVLVGTTSVEKSEKLSERLTRKYAIQHEVLNAKQHEREAHIIQNAGALGAVMIATNMAGRGTDIKLQSVDREGLLRHWQRRQIAPREVEATLSDEDILRRVYRFLGERHLGIKKTELESLDDAQIRARLLRHWAGQNTIMTSKEIETASEEELVRALDGTGTFLLHRLAIWQTTEQMGGLHVIGTERHESRRIDNQLRGRSGRQGDNGSSRFFISLEDELMQMFAGETTLKVLSRLGMKEGDAIEHPMLTKAVERAQRKVEERNFEVRKQILDYDEVMDHQRTDFYGRRQRILEGRGLREIVMEYLRETISDGVERFLSDDYVPTCIGEWIAGHMEVSIAPDRLAVADREELHRRIQADAAEDARATIDVTIGEFMNAEMEPSDWDVKGLQAWAKSKWGVDLKATEVREMRPSQVGMVLLEAAKARIDETDLSELDTYLTEGYGLIQFVEWINTKFEFGLKVSELEGKSPVEIEEFVVARATAAYADREARYPVDYACDATAQSMVQDPMSALKQLATWSRYKLGVNWDEMYLMTRTPQQYREELYDHSRRWIRDDMTRKAAQEAASEHGDDASLEQWFNERFGLRMLAKEKGLTGDARMQMILEKIERFQRSEITQFERFVLLQVLDTSWKDHLYAMDQLRNSINFRAFAQQDPRIEYRREGRRLYDEMNQRLRDQVSDLIFKARLTANHQPRSAYRGMATMQRSAPATGAMAARQQPQAAGQVPAEATRAAMGGRA